MVLSLKPFGCMPSIAVRRRAVGRDEPLQGHDLPAHRDSGEGEVNAHSRVQMALGEAKAKASSSSSRRSQSTGQRLDDIRAYVARAPGAAAPVLPSAASSRASTGTAAQFRAACAATLMDRRGERPSRASARAPRRSGRSRQRVARHASCGEALMPATHTSSSASTSARRPSRRSSSTRARDQHHLAGLPAARDQAAGEVARVPATAWRRDAGIARGQLPRSSSPAPAAARRRADRRASSCRRSRPSRSRSRSCTRKSTPSSSSAGRTRRSSSSRTTTTPAARRRSRR